MKQKNVYCIQRLKEEIILFCLILNRNVSKSEIYDQILNGYWLVKLTPKYRKKYKNHEKRKMDKIWVFGFENIDFSRKKLQKVGFVGVQNSVPMVW
jgi:hypothetical protein